MTSVARAVSEESGRLRQGLDTWDQAVDWSARLEAEGPAIDRWLDSGPTRRVLDLGSATGEMAAWLAHRGYEVVGIEGVRERWEVAAASAPDRVEHLLGDLGAVEAMVRGQFGGAVCLGDTLPALLGVESLARMLVGLRRRLLPDAPFVAQLTNFARLRQSGAVAQPVRVLRREHGDLAFVRLLDLRDDGVVDVTETVLRHRPLADPAVELLASRPVFLQAWTEEQLRAALDVAQFRRVDAYSDFAGTPFEATTSSQLILVAR